MSFWSWRGHLALGVGPEPSGEWQFCQPCRGSSAPCSLLPAFLGLLLYSVFLFSGWFPSIWFFRDKWGKDRWP